MIHFEENKIEADYVESEIILPIHFMEKLSISKEGCVESVPFINLLFQFFDKGKVNFSSIQIEIDNSDKKVKYDTRIKIHLTYYKKINNTFHEKSYTSSECSLMHFLQILYRNYKNVIQN